MAKKQARCIVLRKIKAGLLGFDVREAGKSVRVGKTETLERLRIEIEFGACVGLLVTEKSCHAERVARLPCGFEAVCSGVCGGERRVGLTDESRLHMDTHIIADRLRKNPACRSGSGGIVVETIVQPEQNPLEREIGIIVLASNRKVGVGASEIEEGIFELGAQIRGQQNLDTGTRRPAGPPEVDVVVDASACEIRGVQSVSIIGETSGAIDEPVAEHVTDATA